jgi:hypothetical protein
MSWVKETRFAYDEAITYCDLCGRPMRARVWEVRMNGTTRRFCDRSCEIAYREYWLPRYGRS